MPKKTIALTLYGQKIHGIEFTVGETIEQSKIDA